MPSLTRNFSPFGPLHPRENIVGTGTIGALNAEVVIDCDGSASAFLDLRGTFNLTIELSGTIDGTNWELIPVKPRAGGIFVIAVVGSAAGVWKGSCSGYRRLRARCTAYTSGAATTTLMASTSPFDDATKDGGVTSSLGTNTGAAGAAVTLTLAAPGVGVRHYLTYLSINRFATALLTAAATPALVTTTNLPGTLVFSFPADAAAQGTMFPWREDFAYPLATVTQNTATTIVAPATTGVIWRITAGFYVAP